ncbi:MAG TPA: hypothetical protein VIV57_16745 [Anaeromyxobacter sp.]
MEDAVELGAVGRPRACALALAVAWALGAPGAARAHPHELRLPPPELSPIRLGLAGRVLAAEERGEPSAGSGEAERPRGDEKPSLDFDLLGAAKPPPEPADSGSLRLRRKMLGVHQGIGLGLLGLQLATTAVGQLNYSDRFPAGPDTGRYKLSHQALAYTTLGVFAVNGALALLAPSAKTPKRLDRVMVHRIAMFTAAAGMATQAVLGIQTRERVGRLDQERLATVHLAVGYATLAAVLTGVGAIVF